MSFGVRLIALGGVGEVTQNMYLYQYEEEMLLVDCGIGFPSQRMPGVDVVIPDISYVLEQLELGNHLVGMILTHGHDDHIAALPYLLPHLPNFPIYGSPLTIGFARQRIAETNLTPDFRVIQPLQQFVLGSNFSAKAFRVTHSVPDTMHYAISTPSGIIYHGSDFRLDPTPVGNQASQLSDIAQLQSEKVICMLIDSLRVERPKRSESESIVGPQIEKTMMQTEGKFIVTLMSSHIHRIQQVADAAKKHGRKMVFIGRSVEQNVKIALDLGLLHIEPSQIVDKRDSDQLRDVNACLVVAGSQGQEGSSLIRAISGEHPMLQIKPTDTVVFSADAIPGNERAYFGAIDELANNGVNVIYPDVNPDLHKSGHASAEEQRELVELIKPMRLMPIGGANRHRHKFKEFVAAPLGYSENQVLLPSSGEVLLISESEVKVTDVTVLRPSIVDGLGIGDVGPSVLSDRRSLGDAGIVVVLIPKKQGKIQPKSVRVISRGFVFMQQADDVVEFIIKTTQEIISSLPKTNEKEVIKSIERRLGRRLYKTIRREPLIVASIIEL